MASLSMEERVLIERSAIRAVLDRCVDPEGKPYLYVGTARAAANLHRRVINSYFISSSARALLDSESGRVAGLCLPADDGVVVDDGRPVVEVVIPMKSLNELLVGLNQYRGKAKALSRSTFYRLVTILKAAGLWQQDPLTGELYVFVYRHETRPDSEYVSKVYNQHVRSKGRIAAWKDAQPDEGEPEPKPLTKMDKRHAVKKRVFQSLLAAEEAEDESPT